MNPGSGGFKVISGIYSREQGGVSMKRISLPMAFLFLAACSGSNVFRADAGADGEIPGDAEGDSISDEDEGRDEDVDTDGDTVPDWEDEDSDGDTIPDDVEAGDDDPDTPPVDTDGDTIPDFRDLDSDGNGVLDEDEGYGDADGDGILDYMDLDNDGDGIDDVTEIGGNPAHPVDTDGDGIEDYFDIDSDGDTIGDADERPEGSDVDGDGRVDRHDLDTDRDGIPDSEEAGDADVTTPPVDTDGDGIADFRDLDSDGDGLSDEWEHDHGTDPTDDDSDDDGVPDLIEVGAGTDPSDAADSPRLRGDFVFIVPYNDPGAPPEDPLDPEPEVDHLLFETSLKMADVFFTLDSSGSMGGEIENLRTSLRETVVPGVRAAIPDVWIGVGRFEDCMSCSHNMSVMQAITDDVGAVETALTGWSLCGGREPYTHNLYCLATGDLTDVVSWGGIFPTAWSCAPPGSIGWPCFRYGAMPIIVQFGDEPWGEAISSCTPGKTHDDAIDALGQISAKYVGVNSGSSRADMEIIAEGTASVDTSGEPLVFDISSAGTGLGTQVVDAIATLANDVTVVATTRLRDDDSDLVDAVVEFIDHVEPSAVGGHADPLDPTKICAGGLSVGDEYEPFDGMPDSFTSVLPGTLVCFDIHVKQNWTVPALPGPQAFRCEIDVIANTVTTLDTRVIHFLVPPVF